MKDPDHPDPLANLSNFLHTAQRSIGLSGEVGVRIVSNAQMRRLNREFRGKDKPTDVLSFPVSHNGNGRSAGDIAISSAIARANAKALGHSLENEMKILLLHGLLHLAGHDHESDNGEMERLEQGLRAKLRLPVGLIERTTSGSPALKRKIKRNSLSGALKRSSPLINEGAFTNRRGGVSGGSPLLQQGGAGLQSSGKKRVLKKGALAPEGSPALKRKIKRNSLSGALKRSSPLINEGAPTNRRGGVSGGSPLLQQGGAGLQSSGKKRVLKKGALAPEGSPALKRKNKRNSLSGALKRSFPRINAGAPTLKARIGTAKAVPSQNKTTHSRKKAARAQSKAHSRNAGRTS